MPPAHVLRLLLLFRLLSYSHFYLPATQALFPRPSAVN